MHFVRTFAIMRAYSVYKAYRNRRGSNLWKSCIGLTSKSFLKMAGGRMHTPHPNPLDPILAYFSHFAPLILFFFTKRQSQIGRGHDSMPP